MRFLSTSLTQNCDTLAGRSCPSSAGYAAWFTITIGNSSRSAR